MGRGQNNEQGSAKALLFGAPPRLGPRQTKRTDSDYLENANKLSFGTGPFRNTRGANCLWTSAPYQAKSESVKSYVALGLRPKNKGAKTPFGEMSGKDNSWEFVILYGSEGIDPWRIEHIGSSLDKALAKLSRELDKVSKGAAKGKYVLPEAEIKSCTRARFEQAFAKRIANKDLRKQWLKQPFS